MKAQRIRQIWHLASAALCALAASGCHQELACQELGDCGGDPVGGWTLSPGHGACSEDLSIPPEDKRLVGGDLPAARTPPAEPAVDGWCGGLIAASPNILQYAPDFYTDSAQVGVATMRYDAGGTYAMTYTLVGTYSLILSGACMRQFGATDGRPPPMMDALGPMNICKQLEVPLREAGAKDEFFNTTCSPNPQEPAGCICFFDRAELFEFGGTYSRVSTNEILHTPSAPGPMFPNKATYCRSGSSLQLTGSNNSYLFDQPGLRTLDLGAANCADGAQGPGEEGVDCGSVCNVPCAAPP